MLEAIVGSATAERVLLYLQAYDEAYGREIAAALRLRPKRVQPHPATVAAWRN